MKNFRPEKLRADSSFPKIGADFWEGDATKRFSVKKSGFQ